MVWPFDDPYKIEDRRGGDSLYLLRESYSEHAKREYTIWERILGGAKDFVSLILAKVMGHDSYDKIANKMGISTTFNPNSRPIHHTLMNPWERPVANNGTGLEQQNNNAGGFVGWIKSIFEKISSWFGNIDTNTPTVDDQVTVNDLGTPKRRSSISRRNQTMVKSLENAIDNHNARSSTKLDKTMLLNQIDQESGFERYSNKQYAVKKNGRYVAPSETRGGIPISGLAFGPGQFWVLKNRDYSEFLFGIVSKDKQKSYGGLDNPNHPIYDPDIAYQAIVRQTARYTKKYGSQLKAAFAYNAGPGRLEEYLKKMGYNGNWEDASDEELISYLVQKRQSTDSAMRENGRKLSSGAISQAQYNVHYDRYIRRVEVQTYEYLYHVMGQSPPIKRVPKATPGKASFSYNDPQQAPNINFDDPALQSNEGLMAMQSIGGEFNGTNLPAPSAPQNLSASFNPAEDGGRAMTQEELRNYSSSAAVPALLLG